MNLIDTLFQPFAKFYTKFRLYYCPPLAKAVYFVGKFLRHERINKILGGNKV